jgi:hypothetical protein
MGREVILANEVDPMEDSWERFHVEPAPGLKLTMHDAPPPMPADLIETDGSGYTRGAPTPDGWRLREDGALDMFRDGKYDGTTGGPARGPDAA